MQIDVLNPIVDLDGAAIPIGNGNANPLTIADVFIQALLCAPRPNTIYSPSEVADRYALALAVNRVRRNETPEGDRCVNVSPEMAELLIVDINRNYGPIVTGQMQLLLDYH